MATNCGLCPARVGTVGGVERLLCPVGQVPACADAGRDARAERGRPSAPALPALSLGHNYSASVQPGQSHVEKPEKVGPSATAARIWKKGSRADLPGISDMNRRNKTHTPPTRRPRGIIETLSDASRRNLGLKLATITWSALAFTMALTLPGDFTGISSAWAKCCFVKLLNRSTASRDPLIQRVGWLWKQELQQRGAVHFHLVLYGLLESDQLLVQTWFAENWNDLICEKSTPEERTKHFLQHMRQAGGRNAHGKPELGNFQEIRDFAGYFSKYLGKDAEAQLAEEPIPGRWWGIVNRKCIPWAELAEVELPRRVRLHAQRVARKIRQKRADAAKHRADMKVIDAVHHLGDNMGKPIISQFQLSCGRGALTWLVRATAKMKGVRLGKCKFPAAMQFSAVKFIGKDAPQMVGRILLYAYGRACEDKETMPF